MTGHVAPTVRVCDGDVVEITFRGTASINWTPHDQVWTLFDDVEASPDASVVSVTVATGPQRRAQLPDES